MPFSIEDFPIEVSEPKIDVNLPEGRYIFELVVEDSAGLKSTPDQVVITVKREIIPEPKITGITLRFGLPGQKVKAKIQGDNLLDAHEVLFWRNLAKGPDSRLEATIQAEGTVKELPISIWIKNSADFGEYSYTVATPGGEARSPDGLAFNVVGKPEIDDIDPVRTYYDQGFETIALITGRHLWIPGESAANHKVEFIRGTEPNQAVVAEIINGTPEQLQIKITVKENFEGAEDHTVKVTTPAGKGESPPDLKFKVLGPFYKAKDS